MEIDEDGAGAENNGGRGFHSQKKKKSRRHSRSRSHSPAHSRSRSPAHSRSRSHSRSHSPSHSRRSESVSRSTRLNSSSVAPASAQPLSFSSLSASASNLFPLNFPMPLIGMPISGMFPPPGLMFPNPLFASGGGSSATGNLLPAVTTTANATTTTPATTTTTGATGGVDVFVCGLPSDMSENTLTSLFRPFGPVSGVRVIRDSATAQPKGYGFVTYANLADATKAIEQVNGLKVGNKTLMVKLGKKQ
eukprot:TRINITY_DN4276_c0_g2_i14.p1 TRINITY_DN4276_c0_g2~~TRINITY_DN4276_c0_g2_i14.p1  ORF type:complete len:283 (+),score=64.40 TRINITY_DN4276_c0_g2_i14:107-850(+)